MCLEVNYSTQSLHYDIHSVADVFLLMSAPPTDAPLNVLTRSLRSDRESGSIDIIPTKSSKHLFASDNRALRFASGTLSHRCRCHTRICSEQWCHTKKLALGVAKKPSSIPRTNIQRKYVPCMIKLNLELIVSKSSHSCALTRGHIDLISVSLALSSKSRDTA